MEQRLYEILQAYCDDFNEKRKNYPDLIVDNSIPIVWFGDLEKYQSSPVKIVTVGLNPSWHEFLENNKTPLKKARFNHIDLASPDDKNISALYRTLNEYFYRNPYCEYFKQYEKLLQGIGASFYQKGSENIALHVDAYTSIATNPFFGELSPSAQWGFKTDGMKLYRNLIKYLRPDVLLVSVAKNDFYALYPHIKLVKKYDDPNKKGVYIYTFRPLGNDEGQLILGRNFNGTPFGGRSCEETIKILQEILAGKGSTK